MTTTTTIATLSLLLLSLQSCSAIGALKRPKLRLLKCPANQQFLPNVQHGCPASCDQLVPLCKAASGPGCGCGLGKVLAGSSRPLRPNECIQRSKCNNSSTNDCSRITCALGQRCDPHANFGRGGCVAVPRPQDDTTTATASTTTRSRSTDSSGGQAAPPIVENTEPSRAAPGPPSAEQEESTQEQEEKEEEGDSFACPLGQPVKDPDTGEQLFCGRGRDGQSCPTGSLCNIHPADGFAICCTANDLTGVIKRPRIRGSRRHQGY